MLTRRLLPFLALALFLPQDVAAQGPERPYQVRIVLHFAPHRLLTEVFQNQVKRQLGDSLRAAYDDLARINVIAGHPRLEEIERVGLEKALDGWKDQYPYKTHFVLVSYARSTYEVRARQHDGLTGLASPVVRRQTTRDPAFVARIAGLLVQQDFGLLGTATSAPDASDLVKVRLRGAGAGVDLSRWVKEKDVFALARAPAGSAPGVLIPWTYLQVKEPPGKDGVCLCKLWHRYDVQGDRLPGLWAVSLGTIRAPLRLRLMLQQADGGLAPLDAADVFLEIRDQGFAGDTRLQLRADEAGYVETVGREGDKGLFGPLAFVTAQGSATQKAQIPVAVVSDQPVVVPLSNAAEGSSLFAVRLRTFRSNLYESLLIQSKSLQEIIDLEGERAARIARAQTVLARSEEDYARLKEERNRLLADIRGGKLPGFDPLTLDAEKKSLQRLDEGVKRLTQYIEQQQKIDKEEKDPSRAEALQQVEDAKGLEQRGDIEEALAIYVKAQDVLKSEGLDKHVADLKGEWKVKSDKHAQARHFIYKVWPDLDLGGLEQRFDDARAAFAVVRKTPEVNDYHAARKLLRSTEGHANKMLKRLGELRPDINIEDEEPARRIKDLAPKLVTLGEEIQAYLDQVGK